jgi:hypothetical protein
MTMGQQETIEASKTGATTQQLTLGMHTPELKEIDGEKVYIVKSATLDEVSFVELGACGPAACSLADAETCRSLEQDAKGFRIAVDTAAGRFVRAANNLLEALRTAD